MDGGDHEWELSKENVQPLRHGRHMASLVAALNPEQSEEHMIKTQKNNFELELRTYSGDDPFSVWESYIKWNEQHFPKGGHEGQLMKLLERCLREFQSDERYTNDLRFINMWIKFACFTEDPVIIFSYMFDNGIGVNVASFYVEWAQSLERKGDNNKADVIYLEGLNRQADPKDLILIRHKQFQSRLARNISVQVAESQNPGMDMGEDVEKRAALGRLKSSGSSHKIGAVRTGNVKLGSAGSLKDIRPAVPKQVSSRGVPIFRDVENVVPSLLPQQSNEWQSLPVQAVDNRENDKLPGVWTDAKLKQRPGIAASAISTVPFQIHEDTDNVPIETPKKTTLINTQPLSSRKASQTDVLSSIRRPPAGTFLMEIPMYQKNKIYNGLSEFSFEELRTVKYWKQKKEREAEAERISKEEQQRLKDEIMQRQLLEVTEQLAIMRAHLNRITVSGSADQQIQHQTHLAIEQTLTSEVQELSACMSANIQHTSDSQSTSMQSTTLQITQPLRQECADNSNSSTSNSFITPTNVIASLATKQENLGDPQFSSSRKCLRTPIFNSASTYSSTGSSSSFSRSRSLHHLAGTSSVNSSLECSTVSSTGSSSIAQESSEIMGHPRSAASAQENAITVTPMGKIPFVDGSFMPSGSSSLHKLHPSSTPRYKADSHNSSNIKGPLTAPSPTVYTKEALQCVMGMFSTSFGCDSHLMTEEIDAIHGIPAASVASQLPFEIHEDTTGTFRTEQQSLKNVSGKFQNVCYESNDKEIVLNSTIPQPQALSNNIGGMVIYQDEPEDKGRSSGNVLEIYHDQSDDLGACGSSKGHHIYCDEPDDRAAKVGIKGLYIYQDEPEDRAPKVGNKGLYIYQDEMQDKENEVNMTSSKKSARRGLGFASSEDVEMIDVDKLFQPLTCDFTIECQARDDTTLAALDSFNLQAKAVSTPFYSIQDKSRSKTQELGETVSVSNSMAGSTNLTNLISAACTPSKNLSPIFEGSSEGSAEEAKSCQQSQMTGHVMSSGRSLTGQNIGHTESIQELMEADNENNRDVSMCEDIHRNLDRSCYHEVDTTDYIIPNIKKTKDLLTTSISLDPKDPFDDTTIDFFLKNLNPSIIDYPNFISCLDKLPDLSNNTFLYLGEMYITIVKCIGEGGYAKIYEIYDHCIREEYTMSMESNFKAKVIKVQTPPCHWEFYVSCELRSRLAKLRAPMNVVPSIMEILQGFFYENGSVLLMPHAPLGSLLNLVNAYKDNRTLLAGVEPYACLLTIELLHMFEQIHACGFVHGDVKPDNFLLQEIPIINEGCKNPKEVFGSQLHLVQLIDFGQSIDLTKFPSGTTFRAKVFTSDFQCIEMRTDRPWTFQTDLFGLVGTIHVVLFGTYMKVFQERGVWKVTSNFVRKWNVPLWKQLFNELLNIPSCDKQPDLSRLRAEFEKHFIENLIPSYNLWAREIRTIQRNDSFMTSIFSQ